MLGKNKLYWKEGKSTQVIVSQWPSGLLISFSACVSTSSPVGPGCLFTKYIFYYFLCHMLWLLFTCTAKAYSLQVYFEIQEWNSSLGQICYNLHREKYNTYARPAELYSARALPDVYRDRKIPSWNFHTQVRHSEYFFVAPRKKSLALKQALLFSTN